MKRTKKLASLLLALVMVFAVAVTVLAEGSGSITVDNAVVDQTYTIYEILRLESYNADTNAYSYKATGDWEEFINGDGSIYVDVNKQGYVTWHEGADASAFAKAAQAYAGANSIPNQGSKTATSTTVKFENLELGYYLMDSTLGTLCALDTTTPDVIIKEKNEVPSNEKTVEEDSSKKYGSVNDADIGQTVNFKSTVTLPAGSENVIFHDTMSAGLTLNAESVQVYTDVGLTTKLDAASYTLKTPGLSDTCTFEIAFSQEYLNGLKEKAVVYVVYSAVVNENAVVGGEGNPNTSHLSYGDKSNTKTTPGSNTTTYTWSFDVLKYGNGDESNVLANAEFVLLNSEKSKVAVVENGKLTGWMDLPAVGKDGSVVWSANTILKTDENGKISIAGLDADTYYLREIKAPAGYNVLKDDVEVKIDPTVSDKTTVKVENLSGTELPSTGGMGTTFFYVAGSILLLGAAVLLVTKKRMNAAK